ncbi:M23 family metallopeptidase [Nocardioides caldifontis]|uniref:M23 family metallopeptidase n=1 Tax=Nocardioides caldifontis TaxID=2588938 RepID=UPI001EEFADA0|nr:M23 family metallopeptidase [Nocardioides caldifontis]
MEPISRRARLALPASLAASVATLACLCAAAPGAVAMPAPEPDVGPPGQLVHPSPRPLAAAPSEQPRGEWPLQPRPEVAEHFDPPEVRWGSGHRGADLRGRVGQQVHAALAGTVSFAGRVAGTPVVVVDHGGTRTTYQPVLATVSRGDEVVAGQVVGRLGWAGTHCSPAACLHWGWVRGETYLDPLLLVGAAPRPVRLLPL